MKKIMFNDKYSLTEEVLSRRKTHTRRIIPDSFFSLNWDSREDEKTLIVENDFGDWIDIRHSTFARYKVGEVVAIAQAYKDFVNDECNHTLFPDGAGWTNKMFVRADLMPHRIRFNDVWVERLQDISDEDCIKEGVCVGTSEATYHVMNLGICANTPREAYASLIDKISGKGAWERNPYVFAYEFELIK